MIIALRQGDSGSWVVQPETGQVFGHVIAHTESYVFLVPLTTVFRELDTNNSGSMLRGSDSHPQVCLPPVFDCLIELAKHCHRSGLREAASQYAEQAIKELTLQKSQGSITAKIVERFFASCSRSEDTEQFLSAMLKRTGVDLIFGLIDLQNTELEDENSSRDPMLAERAREWLMHLSKAAGLEWNAESHFPFLSSAASRSSDRQVFEDMGDLPLEPWPPDQEKKAKPPVHNEDSDQAGFAFGTVQHS